MSTNNNAQQTLQELTQQVQNLQHQRNVAKLMELIPRELFLREDGTVDEHRYNQEIFTALNLGYPNRVLTDDRLVNIYAGYLQDLDIQRQKQQAQEEAKDRVRTSILGTDKYNTYRNNNNSGIVPGFPVPQNNEKVSFLRDMFPNRITTPNSYQVVH